MEPVDVDRVIERIEATPNVLRSLLSTAEPAWLAEPPAVGEWSILEVVAHLVHADGPAFRARIEGIATGAVERVPPYDPTLDIDVTGDPAEVRDRLLDRLEEERRRSVELLRSLDAATLDHSVGHRHGGEFSAADFVEEWVFHDADHLQQILEVVKARQLGRVGPSMRDALTD